MRLRAHLGARILGLTWTRQLTLLSRCRPRVIRKLMVGSGACLTFRRQVPSSGASGRALRHGVSLPCLLVVQVNGTALVQGLRKKLKGPNIVTLVSKLILTCSRLAPLGNIRCVRQPFRGLRR